MRCPKRELVWRGGLHTGPERREVLLTGPIEQYQTARASRCSRIRSRRIPACLPPDRHGVRGTQPRSGPAGAMTAPQVEKDTAQRSELLALRSLTGQLGSTCCSVHLAGWFSNPRKPLVTLIRRVLRGSLRSVPRPGCNLEIRHRHPLRNRCTGAATDNPKAFTFAALRTVTAHRRGKSGQVPVGLFQRFLVDCFDGSQESDGCAIWSYPILSSPSSWLGFTATARRRSKMALSA